MRNHKQYSPREMVVSIIHMWTGTMCEFDHQYSVDDTLNKVKEVCEEYDLDIYDVKQIFEEVEDSFYYNIELDEIINCDDFCADCEKQEEDCECE